VVAAFNEAGAADFEPLAAASALASAHVEHAGTLVSGDQLRLWPHVHQTDGFFAAVWQRR
jgi:16S rRNA (cytosine967-C5)-methyltransferase